MTEWQILYKVEVPLALPLIIGGFRSATLQVVATATIAAYIGLGGLGRYLIDGLDLSDYPKMLSGSVLVIGLALFLDGVFAFLQKVAVGGRAPVDSAAHIEPPYDNQKDKRHEYEPHEARRCACSDRP